MRRSCSPRVAAMAAPLFGAALLERPARLGIRLESEPSEDFEIAPAVRRCCEALDRIECADECALVSVEIRGRYFDPKRAVEITNPMRAMERKPVLDVGALSDVDDLVLAEQEVDADKPNARDRKLATVRRDEVERFHEAFLFLAGARPQNSRIDTPTASAIFWRF